MLPIELRRVLDVNEKDAIEFFIDEQIGQIAMKKYRSIDSCLLCSEISVDMVYFKGKQVCRSCINEVPNTPLSPVNIPESIKESQREVAVSSAKPSPSEKWKQSLIPGRKAEKPKTNRDEQEEKIQKLLELHRKEPKLGIMQMAERIDVDVYDLNTMIRKLKNRGEWK